MHKKWLNGGYCVLLPSWSCCVTVLAHLEQNFPLFWGVWGGVRFYSEWKCKWFQGGAGCLASMGRSAGKGEIPVTTVGDERFYTITQQASMSVSMVFERFFKWTVSIMLSLFVFSYSILDFLLSSFIHFCSVYFIFILTCVSSSMHVLFEHL